MVKRNFLRNRNELRSKTAIVNKFLLPISLPLLKTHP